jgi:hypothetical protein
MEMGVYLSIVLIALIVSFENSLDDGGEILLIWGSASGLALAHIFAFRLSQVFEHGLAVAAGWRSVAGMIVAALGVAVLASTPYLVSFESVTSATVATWLLMGFVGSVGYLAAKSRGWSTLGSVAYAVGMLLIAGLISIIKYVLTH